MKDITKLKVWESLKLIGFTPVNYNGHGRKLATGAALQHSIHRHENGKIVGVDIIEIKPFFYGTRPDVWDIRFKDHASPFKSAYDIKGHQLTKAVNNLIKLMHKTHGFRDNLIAHDWNEEQAN